MTSQFHFDPATYLDLMREEVPAYGRLQEAVAAAAEGVAATAVLDLGTGTGETLAAVLERHPGARAVGVDRSVPMLEAAHARLEGRAVDLVVAGWPTPCRTAPSTWSSPLWPSTTSMAPTRPPCSPGWRRCCAPAGASCSATS